MKSITSFIRKITNSQTTKMWLVSYILILVVPIIFSFFSYYYVENSLSKKINEANTNNLSGARTYMDNILNGIVSATVNLSSNNQIISLASNDEQTTSAQIYARNTALNDSNQVWRAHSIFGDFITNKYIYLPNTDSIYTGSILVESEYFLARTYGNLENFNAQKWQDKLFTASKPCFVSIPTGNKSEIFYIFPTYNNKTDVQFYTIVQFNMNTLTRNAAGNNSDYFFVQNDHDITTAANISSPQREAILRSITYGEGHFEVATSSDKMTVIKSPSHNSSLYYGFAIPSSTYRTDVERARIFMWTSSLICILLALIIIIYMINKNNHPLEVIAKTLSGNNDEQLYTDTYQYISDAIKRSISENAQYADKLHKQHDILKENILTNILYGKSNDKFTFWMVLNVFEYVVNGKWCDTWVIIFTHHGIRLSRSGGSIRKDCTIRSVHYFVDNITHHFLINLIGIGDRIEYAIEMEGVRATNLLNTVAIRVNVPNMRQVWRWAYADGNADMTHSFC